MKKENLELNKNNMLINENNQKLKTNIKLLTDDNDQLKNQIEKELIPKINTMWCELVKLEEIKTKLEKIREENKQKSILEQKTQSLKMKEINHNLTAKQIKEKNEQRIKNEIDRYWDKNNKLLNTSISEDNKKRKKKQSNT